MLLLPAEFDGFVGDEYEGDNRIEKGHNKSNGLFV
jgi:hypothetical protein